PKSLTCHTSIPSARFIVSGKPVTRPASALALRFTPQTWAESRSTPCTTVLIELRQQRRPGYAMVEKTATFRQRRAADTARWRERLHRGAAVYPVEVDGMTFDLMERFGGLKDSKTGDRRAVATALGRLLRRALEALLREEAASCGRPHPHILVRRLLWRR